MGKKIGEEEKELRGWEKFQKQIDEERKKRNGK